MCGMRVQWPPDHSPLAALSKKEGPSALAKAHSHDPLLLGSADLVPGREDASVARGGRGVVGGSHEMPCEPFLSSYLVSLSGCQLECSPWVLLGAVCSAQVITVSAQEESAGLHLEGHPSFMLGE